MCPTDTAPLNPPKPLQCSILTEGPAFQFQSVLLARIPVSFVMHGSMLLLALRLVCYTFLRNAPSPWCVLPVELLQGEC